jgi:hypothetical protein
MPVLAGGSLLLCRKFERATDYPAKSVGDRERRVLSGSVMSDAEPETSVAAKRAALVTSIYLLVPEGEASAASIADILTHFPPHGGPSRGSLRAWLLKLARVGLVIKTRASSSNAEMRFYREEGEASAAELVVLKLWPPRPPCPKKIPLTGKAVPQVAMRISSWKKDKLGNLWRTVTGVAAPVAVAMRAAAGRAGGLASARARKAKPAYERRFSLFPQQ